MKRCLYCYQILNQNEVDFHSICSKKFFGFDIPPDLPYTEKEMQVLGESIIRSQIAVTGVQPKLSLTLHNTTNRNEPKRFTIVGLCGNYILKPPTINFIKLPEVEDLTMHLAKIAKINVVPHSLIRLASGNLGYITKRIDRIKNEKLLMEDMCQLSERLTEYKYHGSYEQIAKIILKYSSSPGLDIVNFYEQVLFSFLTGNADMHLKNFSIINLPKIGYALTPAYDMMATAIVNPLDDEDLALTLNGKKKKINRKDFIVSFNNLKLDSKQQENIFNKMEKSKEKWFQFIAISFLSEVNKLQLIQLIEERFTRLEV
jgi:serine/threonine-protein kinase HipA